MTGPSYNSFGAAGATGADSVSRADGRVNSSAEVDRTQVYPVNGQEVVTDKVSAVRRVDVSVVCKEPRFHEETQEW